MAAEFSVESVKAYILEKGGRIQNHELVTHFKNFLNHPVNKAINREKFKDFVNELATIKVEEGDKVLVLKRKHRPDSTSSLSSNRASTISSSDQPSPAKAPYQPASDASYPASSQQPQEADVPRAREPISADAMRARSEPPVTLSGDAGPREEDGIDGGFMSKVHSDENLDVRLKSSTRPSAGPGGQKQPFESSTPSLASVSSQGSLSSVAETMSPASAGEEDGNVSVLSIKERVQHLNKMSSESDLQHTHSAVTPRAKKNIKDKDKDDDDESHSSSGASYITLSPEEKEWMLISATADYHEMFRMLSKNGRLAKVKDIANGTALHWAAKFGKPEVVKMLANKTWVNVNQRSGGYTPLHLAAIHGHEEIIELLVTVYKADSNIRDYSGKKAKQYLKNSASSRAQQLLVSRRLGPDFGSGHSLDDSFTRSVTARQSNRARALSSLIQATSSVMRQPLLRSSWEGPHSDDGGDKTPGSTPPGSATSSPQGSRRHKDDKHLMPPPGPHASSHRRRRGDRSASSSRESLNTQTQSSSAISNKENTIMTVPRSESDPAIAKKTFV